MDATHSKYLVAGIASLGVAAICFLTGWLLFAPGHAPASAPAQFNPPPDPTPPTLAVAPPDSAKPARTHKYNLTIETTADWSTIRLVAGQFVQGDGQALNSVEISSDNPAQITHFTYAPTEIDARQVQFATARIVIKAVVESADPVLQVRIGHGDNGAVKISSPADSFTNDQRLGDGQNFVLGSLRLE